MKWGRSYRECAYTLVEVPCESVASRAAFVVGHALRALGGA